MLLVPPNASFAFEPSLSTASRKSVIPLRACSPAFRAVKSAAKDLLRLADGMPAQLLGKHAADGVQGVRIQIAAYVNHRITHDAAVGHNHQQRALRAYRHQLERRMRSSAPLGLITSDV